MQAYAESKQKKNLYHARTNYKKQYITYINYTKYKTKQKRTFMTMSNFLSN